MKSLSRLLITCILLLMIPTSAIAGGGGWKFKDVPETHEYYTSIDYYRGLEMLFGGKDEDGLYTMMYRPDDYLNRAEFATLMYRIASPQTHFATSAYHHCFPDVNNEWYAAFVCWAEEKQYVSGFSAGELEGLYGPDQQIRIGELTVILSRIYGWEDQTDNAEWYTPSMTYAKNHNIIDDSSYADFVTRGYVAELMYRSFIFNSIEWAIQNSGSEVDFDTLQYVKDFYLKDKDSVFDAAGKIIPELDPDTLEVLSDPFIKDADTVYHANLGVFEEADPETFEHIKGMFFKDKNSVYQAQRANYETEIVNLTETYGLDPETVEVPFHSKAPYYPHGYIKDTDNVYFIEKTVTQMWEADPATFISLSDDNIRYAKDKDHVYLDSYVLEGANPDTYEILDAHGIWYYSKDDKYAFFQNTIIPGSDPSTFEVLDYGYSKDFNNIYYQGFGIYGVDYESFEHLDYGYAKDKNNAYYLGGVIQDIDIDTFELISKYHYIDKDHVYREGQIIEGADPETFEYLRSYYSRDKNFVYRNHENNEPTNKFDSMTFEEFSNGYAKDNNYVYYKEEIIEGADVETFEFISGLYAKDKNYAYMNGHTLLEEDPEFFVVTR